MDNLSESELRDVALALLNLAHDSTDDREAELLMQRSLEIFREIGDDEGVKISLECIQNLASNRRSTTEVDCPFCEQKLDLEDGTNGTFVCLHCENEFFYLA